MNEALQTQAVAAPSEAPGAATSAKERLKNTPYNSPFHAGPYCQDGNLVLSESFWISDYTRLETLNDATLADVLAIWEGEDGQWVRNAPLVLRFDSIDCVVRPRATGSKLTVWLGVMNTASPIHLVRNTTVANKYVNRFNCLQWLSRTSFRPYIGSKVSRVWVETEAEGRGSLTSCMLATRLWLQFEDGRTLVLTNDKGNLNAHALVRL